MKGTSWPSYSVPNIPHWSHSRAISSALGRIKLVSTEQIGPLSPKDLTEVSSDTEKQGSGGSESGVQSWLVAAPGLESVASTPEERRSASIIQAFFRRRGRRAGGIIAAVCERLAQKLKKRTRNYNLVRPLLLCIRGPLPHVLAYLRTLKILSDESIQTLNQNMKETGYENLEELYEKGVEAR